MRERVRDRARAREWVIECDNHDREREGQTHTWVSTNVRGLLTPNTVSLSLSLSQQPPHVSCHTSPLSHPAPTAKPPSLTPLRTRGIGAHHLY